MEGLDNMDFIDCIQKPDSFLWDMENGGRTAEIDGVMSDIQDLLTLDNNFNSSSYTGVDAKNSCSGFVTQTPNIPEIVKALESQETSDFTNDEPNIFKLADIPQPNFEKNADENFVRQKIRNTIKQKNGNKPLPPVDFTPKPAQEPSQEEKEKAEQRKQKNRESAARSRQNQKHRLMILEKRVNDLERENELLQNHIKMLEANKEKCSQIMNGHVCKCYKQKQLKKEKITKALQVLLSQVVEQG